MKNNFERKIVETLRSSGGDLTVNQVTSGEENPYQKNQQRAYRLKLPVISDLATAATFRSFFI